MIELFLILGGSVLGIVVLALGVLWCIRLELCTIKGLPVSPELPEDYWQPEDADALLAFRRSGTGIKFFTILDATATTYALEAVRDTTNTIHSAGHAGGIAWLVSKIKGLCPQPISSAGTQSGNFEEAAQQGVPADLAHFTP